jgi:DNA-binding MarR family transcriptional regulator
MGGPDHIDRLLERLAAIPAVEHVDPVVEGITDRISVISRRFMLRNKEKLDEHGITWREWQVLTHLMLAGDTPCSPGDLAGSMMVGTGAMTNVLDRMEKRKLVRRVRNPKDRRSVIVETTAGGRRLWEAAVNELGTGEAAVVGTLTRKEQSQLNELLRKLLGAFGSDDWSSEDDEA